MKKFWIIAAAAIMMASCAEKSDVLFEEPQVIESRMQYDAETLRCINSVYSFCVDFSEKFEIPAYMILENPTIEQEIAVIRYCDLQDESGDVFPGWDEYDTIKDILWPDGYGK